MRALNVPTSRVIVTAVNISVSLLVFVRKYITRVHSDGKMVYSLIARAEQGHVSTMYF